MMTLLVVIDISYCLRLSIVLVYNYFHYFYVKILNARHIPSERQLTNRRRGDPSISYERRDKLRSLSDLEIVDEAVKSVTLIDLAGCSKYLKTALHGIVGHRPQYCLICVSAVAGLQSITIEHIGISIYLKIPLIFVITKIDCIQMMDGHHHQQHNQQQQMVSLEEKQSDLPNNSNDKHKNNNKNRNDGKGISDVKSVLDNTINSINKVLLSMQSSVTIIASDTELSQYCTHTDVSHASRQCPLFLVSNTTGEGLALLRSYLFQLPKHHGERSSDNFDGAITHGGSSGSSRSSSSSGSSSSGSSSSSSSSSISSSSRDESEIIGNGHDRNSNMRYCDDGADTRLVTHHSSGDSSDSGCSSSADTSSPIITKLRILGSIWNHESCESDSSTIATAPTLSISPLSSSSLSASTMTTTVPSSSDITIDSTHTPSPSLLSSSSLSSMHEFSQFIELNNNSHHSIISSTATDSTDTGGSDYSKVKMYHHTIISVIINLSTTTTIVNILSLLTYW